MSQIPRNHPVSLHVAFLYEGDEATTTSSILGGISTKTYVKIMGDHVTHICEQLQFVARYVSVPVMSLYNMMVIYLFLPIPRKDVALGAGLTVSAICLVMYAALSAAKVGQIQIFHLIQKNVLQIFSSLVQCQCLNEFKSYGQQA